MARRKQPRSTTPVGQGTRDRIVLAGTELFGRNGFNATGVKQIVAAANAPFGSLYHFFPDGKHQLAEEVIRTSGPFYPKIFELIFDAAPDLLTGIATLFASAADTLVDTDFADACPIATVALEVASTHEPLRKATADVFDQWISAGTAMYLRWGLDEENARSLAITTIISLEGAFVLSRSLRNTEALAVAGAAVAEVARGMIGPESRHRDTTAD